MKNIFKLFTGLLAVMTSAVSCHKFEITDSSMTGGVITIHVGEYHLLTTDSGKECVWTASDPTVVSIFGSYVYGVSPGTCTVTGKIGSVQRSVQVAVLATDVLDFKFDRSELGIVPGYTATFNVIDLEPYYASADMLTWGFAETFPYNDHFSFSISGNTVSVSADSTTPANAEALLLAHGYKGVSNGDIVEAMAEIRISVTGFTIHLDQTRLTMEVGDTEELVATVSTGSDFPMTVSWDSSDPSVASCTDGVVEALSEGSAIITASAGGKTATCSVDVKKKRNLPDNYKICFYKKASYSGDDIEMSDPITSLDVIRGGWARPVYVGAEDGLPVPKGENGKGCTAVFTNEKSYVSGERYTISEIVYFGMSATETSGSVTVTAPNENSATLQVNGVFGSVSLIDSVKKSVVLSTVTGSGGTIDLYRPTDNTVLRCCFAANLYTTYDSETSYDIHYDDPLYLKLRCEQDSDVEWESLRGRCFQFTRNSTKKVYEFHIVDGPTGGGKLDYVVKINLK